MSLVYGDLPMSDKQALLEGMREKGEVKGLEGRKEGTDGSDMILGMKEFRTHEVLIVKTAGKSDEWTIEGRVQIGERGKARLSHEEL